MEVAAIQLTTMIFPNAMINDVIVTEDAAYFTNSFQAEIYKVSLNTDGTLAMGGTALTIALTGDFSMGLGFNANGIVASDDGSQLIIANSVLGKLYLTDPATGMTTEIDLGGASVPNADGLVLRGNRLYVVQNFNNQITVLQLSGDWTSGTIINTITDSDFHIPATATIRGNTIYVVNAKFDIAPPPFLGLGYDPTIPFEIVAVNAN
jgi:sugar lactone lactonase YvrE